MRVSVLPKLVFEQRHVIRVEGIFDLNVYDSDRMRIIITKATLIVGRKSFDRRDSYLKPWCRIQVPPIGAELISNYLRDYNKQDMNTHPIFSNEEPSEFSQFVTSDQRTKLNASVRTMDVSGRFYHMVTVFALDKGDSLDYGLRLLNHDDLAKKSPSQHPTSIG
jgi:hypothetical protein